MTYREDSKPERTFVCSECFAVMKRAREFLNVSVHLSVWGEVPTHRKHLVFPNGCFQIQVFSPDLASEY